MIETFLERHARETLVRVIGQALVAAMPVQDRKEPVAVGSLLGKLLFLDDDVTPEPGSRTAS